MKPEGPEGVAYRKMAHFYRPAAPSDGMGHITVPLVEGDLEKEIELYKADWEFDGNEFFIGSATFADREALVWIIEAARNLCGVNREVAVRLLHMALADIEQRVGQ